MFYIATNTILLIAILYVKCTLRHQNYTDQIVSLQGLTFVLGIHIRTAKCKILRHKILRTKKFKKFVDDQYLIISVEFNFAELGKSAKLNSV